MCKFCEENQPVTPFEADVPRMDEVEMFADAAFNLDTKRRVNYLVVYDYKTDDEALFKIRFCPMCGRKLTERDR